MITKAPILTHYKQSVKTIMKTNLLNYISSKVLFQLGNSRLLYLVIFFSKNFNLIDIIRKSIIRNYQLLLNVLTNKNLS